MAGNQGHGVITEPDDTVPISVSSSKAETDDAHIPTSSACRISSRCSGSRPRIDGQALPPAGVAAFGRGCGISSLRILTPHAWEAPGLSQKRSVKPCALWDYNPLSGKP